MFSTRGIGTIRSPLHQAGDLNSAVHVRRSVAVLGFRNLPGRPEDNWLSSAFSEMLNTELAAGGELRMVSGRDVARAKSELPLSDEDSLSKSTLQRLRTNPGADVVVVGSYTMLPADPKRRIRLDVRLQDTAGGETIAEESVSGDENDLFNLVSDLGGKLRRSLGVAAPSRREPKLPHEQLFRLMKRQPASTPRDEQDCGHSTTLRLAIY